MEDFSVSAIMGRMAAENNNFDKVVGEQKNSVEEQRETMVITEKTQQHLDDVASEDVGRDSTKKDSEKKASSNDDVGQMITVHDKAVTTSDEPPRSLLSQALKTGTAKSHSAAENVHFVHNFINGIIDRELYKDMITGLYHIYVTLEQLLEEYAPTFFPSLHFPKELNRVDSLREDMEFWHGYDWESKCKIPSPAVQDYIDRMKEVGRLDPLLLLSHAYTRYLGDLSGGKVLSRIARRALQLGKKNTGDGTANNDDGLQFYNFDNIPSAKLFKDMYRTKLDELSLTSREINKLVAEANVAFALNMRVFEELDVKGGVIGARVRNVREALSYYDIERKGDDGEALSEEEGGEEDGEAKCPFGFGSGPNPHQRGSVEVTKKLAKESLHQTDEDTSRHASSHAGGVGRCPWPFVFFHDPTTGFKDWQTWFVIGIVLCYAWSHVTGL
jgi:heme oxygenase